MIKIKMNKEEILESVPYTLEDVGGDFNKAAVDAALYTLVEKYNVKWERYETVSYEDVVYITKYYDEIYNKNDEKIADIIIIINDAEETVEVEVK